MQYYSAFASAAYTRLLAVIEHPFGTVPRPGLNPISGTVPLTLEAIICPPLIYYIALLFLPPAPPRAVESHTIKALRNIFALLSGFLFFRLPLAYHFPQSIGLNYQLSLVGLYGGCRVLDAFFISPYVFGHIPRRVTYTHQPRPDMPMIQEVYESVDETRKDGDQAMIAKKQVAASDMIENVRQGAQAVQRSRRRSSLSQATQAISQTIAGPSMQPVLETATSDDDWPHSFLDRASWALELELSMRGVGFTWTTADVRHSVRKTWLPTVHNRVHSIFVHVVPILATCFLIIRSTYLGYLEEPNVASGELPDLFDEKLSLSRQLLLTAALGAFLMAAFSFAHSAFAIMLSPFAPSPLAFFPPLYTTRIWDITSVRGFWAYGWHRLFARLFLVYGVWPGEWIERKILGKGSEEPADVGKVLGGFMSSAFVHSFAVRSVLGGDWNKATGEARFFALNGLAVVLEESVKRAVKRWRKQNGQSTKAWYDNYVGRAWWISLLLCSGRQFARGWVNAGLVREMAAK
ncbi:hypothetical protein AAFC00_000999 [Neodothiora populina]